MKLTVGIQKIDEKGNSVREGELHFDGKKTITIDPADSVMLQNIAATPLMWPGPDRPDPPVDPKKDPETFMKNLWRSYRSPYCQALKATVE
jgi:hypothetical protein